MKTRNLIKIAEKYQNKTIEAAQVIAELVELANEKVFWRKVLDIYATSIDYDPSTENSNALGIQEIVFVFTMQVLLLDLA